MNWQKTSLSLLTVIFALLYIGTALVSTFHAIEFFSLSNKGWMAVILSIVFELGMATVTFALLTQPQLRKSYLPWAIMIICTVVQCIGNVYSSYKYADLYAREELKYFIDSVMFFVKSPDYQANKVIVSYITGFLLPIIALGCTGLITSVLNIESPEQEKPKPAKKDAEEAKEVEQNNIMFI